ncbi:DUF4199 domain-containing protein [Brumimicrobium aurantiacum]|uniref:DUF4199 domain-containing protein n=1 Tax=Brumimicrobium aurantiacum TaxID=1737063 RepID=A0A3E1EW33_9FLAO|nr:DUF4199 domain-containing protein [Brumimicrobium aurantiacum]RFC53771.1 DUF4199 domain-containing protein [Brumimicrobium aurantiacum]
MNNFKLEIKWAIIFTISSLVWMFIEKITGLHSTHIDKHYLWTNLFAFIAIAVYVLALLDKRKSLKGKMSFVQGFVSGLKITVIVTLLAPLSQWLTHEVISPEYFTNVIAYSIEEGHYANEADAKAYFNFQNYVQQSVFGAFGMGVFTSAIVALIVKKK